MRVCPNCRQECPENEKFCSRCGCSFVEQQPDPVAPEKNTVMEKSRPAETKAAEQAIQENRRWKGAGILLLIVAGIFGYNHLFGNPFKVVAGEWTVVSSDNGMEGTDISISKQGVLALQTAEDEEGAMTLFYQLSEPSDGNSPFTSEQFLRYELQIPYEVYLEEKEFFDEMETYGLESELQEGAMIFYTENEYIFEDYMEMDSSDLSLSIFEEDDGLKVMLNQYGSLSELNVVDAEMYDELYEADFATY